MICSTSRAIPLINNQLYIPIVVLSMSILVGGELLGIVIFGSGCTTSQYILSFDTHAMAIVMIAISGNNNVSLFCDGADM